MKLRRTLAWSAAVTVLTVVLLAVFAAYLRPDMALTLANQLWACFQ